MGLALSFISFSLVAASHSGLLKVWGSSGPTEWREGGRETQYNPPAYISFFIKPCFYCSVIHMYTIV